VPTRQLNRQDEDIVDVHDCADTQAAAEGAGVQARETSRNGVADVLEALIHGRQHVAPRRLVAPGPDALELERLLRAAAAAPDHGRIAPWRFILVPSNRRALLAETFVAALRERDPEAGPDAVAAASEKAHRAPVLLLAVARLGPTEPDIPAAERLVSLGCAIQNLLLSAEAAGYGSGLTSGQAMDSAALRALFRLEPEEQAVCFVNLGTVLSRRPPRPRPEPADLLGSL
jgi:nitroreductase